MVLSLGVHTFVIALTSALIALVGLSFDRQSLLWLIKELSVKEFNFIMVVMVLLVFCTAIFLYAFPVMRSWFRQRLAYFHPARIGISILLYMMVFAGYGIIMSILVRTLWHVNAHLQWYQFTWGFALAWVLGFIVPGSPGGLGIREIILAGLYSQQLGQGIAIGLSIVLRLITSFGDLIAFILAYSLNISTSKNKK